MLHRTAAYHVINNSSSTHATVLCQRHFLALQALSRAGNQGGGNRGSRSSCPVYLDARVRAAFQLQHIQRPRVKCDSLTLLQHLVSPCNLRSNTPKPQALDPHLRIEITANGRTVLSVLSILVLLVLLCDTVAVWCYT